MASVIGMVAADFLGRVAKGERKQKDRAGAGPPEA